MGINVPDNKIEATLTHDIGRARVRDQRCRRHLHRGNPWHERQGRQRLPHPDQEGRQADDEVRSLHREDDQRRPDHDQAPRLAGDRPRQRSLQAGGEQVQVPDPVPEEDRRVRVLRQQEGEERAPAQVPRQGRGQEGRPDSHEAAALHRREAVQVELFLPILLNKIYSDMNEYKMSVDHVPGDHLNIQTNGKKFKSFVIAKTGNNNERKIEINGKQLASGDYTLTDNSFKTKITLQNGDWLEPKVTWEGALPKSRSEAEKFFLKNNFKISATGSKRNFDIDLSWKATKPDWDFSTPESLKIDINAKGESPRWGN